MSVQRLSETHCWRIKINTEGDEIHFPTAEAAALYVTSSGHTGPDPEEMPVPCWGASCDGEGCIAVEGDENGDQLHIPALTLTHALSDLAELTRINRQLLCEECAEKAKGPEAPVNSRPWILTEQDLCRVFVVLAICGDKLPNIHLEPQIEQALTLVRALVAKPPNGPRTLHSRVLPFAIQPPLPEMPRIPGVFAEGNAR